MNIGCNALYPWAGFTDSELFTVSAYKEALTNLGGAGFQAVEYSHTYHLSQREAARVGELAHSLGLQSWSCHAEGRREFELADNLEEAREALQHCLALCAELGSKVLVLHTPIAPTDDLSLGAGADVLLALARDRSVLEPACRRAAELGLDIALENGHSLAHMRYILRLRDLIGAENLGFCVDTGHAALGDLGPAQAIELAGRYLYTTHLQDNHGRRDDHLPPGEGSIDWPAVFTALKRVGYARTIMLELTDRAEGRAYDQKQELERGSANVRELASRYLAG
jgi:sugar phosphate isomerase/epimerase